LEILWETCRTDADIRHALTALPKNIEETYKRCVCRIKFQDNWALKVLKWVSFAKRPLHIEELREAVAFQLTDTEWSASRKPQKDFIVSCCANLVVFDPTDHCVRFAHSSAKQYLEEDRKRAREERSISGYPTEENGDLECGEYCVTYLSFSDFSLQLTRPSTQKLATTVPSPYAIAQSVPGTGFFKALFRKSQKQTNSISLPFRTIRTPAAPNRAQYKFLNYVIANWAFHTRQIHGESLAWEKFVQLAMCFNETWNFHPWVSGGRSKVSYLHGLFGWAVKERHKPFLSLVSNMRSSMSQFCDLPLAGEGLPAIHLAAKFGYEEIVEILLNFCSVVSVDQDGYTPLHHAAMKGHSKVVRLLLLQREIKVDIMSSAQQTPLWLAASHGFDDTVSLLIHQGAQIEMEDNIRRCTPLWRAVENEHNSTANLLLKNGAQVECQDIAGQTPLGLAIMKRNMPMIDLLLTNGATYKSKDLGMLLELIQWATENNFEESTRLLVRRNSNQNYKRLLSIAIHRGYSEVVKMLLEETSSSIDRELLMWATEKAHIEVVEQLLAKGTDFNIKDEANENATPLHWAAQSSNTAVIKLLLTSGADVNAKDGNEETPLHWAIKNSSGATIKQLLESEAAVELLLENGASVDGKGRGGQTLLHEASAKGHTPVMELLLRNGAHISATNDNMETPLHEATKHGRQAAMRLLLERNASVAVQDNLGQTPLHEASKHWGPKLMKILLDYNPFINCKDHLGKTPLHNASERRETKPMRLLLESGADINSKDHLGKTPLDLAEQRGFSVGAQLLLENGARHTNSRRR
jgi:ankyrin repeat protein